MSELKLVIIGGVAGGMSAATRARRMNEHASIIVLEKGGFISFANCGLPYYLAGRITSEDKLLLTTPQRVRERFNIEARVHHEVVRIDRGAKLVEVRDLAANRTYTLPYDKLILAPGATPILPPIEHVQAPNVFLLRSMEDTRHVHQFIAAHQPKNAVIVGAGFIGLEMAEALHDRSIRVTVVEKAPQVLPPLDPEMAVGLAQELARHEVTIITGNGLKALHAAADGPVATVEVEDGRRFPADLVLLSIGVRPHVGLAAAAEIKLGPSGAIAVDSYQRTSDPDIYAVGDASEVVHGVTGATTRIPLAGPANRQGRLAGEHAATGSAPTAGRVMGTAIVQVFGLAAGLTGLGEAAARKAGFAVDTAYTFPTQHAGYYPDAQSMILKLIYDRSTSRLLGTQAVGAAGIDKRLDVAATILHFSGSIDDMAALDLAYAPQFSSAKDPLHIVAMVAQNQRRGTLPSIAPSELDGQKLVDVRTPTEFAAGTLPGAINIPLDSLRDRLSELDPARPTVVFCQAGLRGYIATRILQQHGFTSVVNVKGGYRLAKLFAALRS